MRGIKADIAPNIISLNPRFSTTYKERDWKSRPRLSRGLSGPDMSETESSPKSKLGRIFDAAKDCAEVSLLQ